MSAPAPSELETSTVAGEQEWLAGWTAGPTALGRSPLREGTRAPDFVLPDHTGRERSLSAMWQDGPVLLMFWRHFGCMCGVARAARLIEEHDGYREAGLRPVIVAQGEPVRAAAYHAKLGLPCPVLCDPDHRVYDAYGLGHWSVERVLFDAPEEFLGHPHELGVAFQDLRRSEGRPPVDDPWRAVADFIVGRDGTIRFTYTAQHCNDHPNPRLLAVAARRV